MYCQYFDMFDSWSFGFFDFGLYGTFNRKYRSRCCKIRSWIGIPHLSWTGSEFTRIIYLGYPLLCHATGKHYIINRYRPRFFDQVGHQTTSAYIENKHFFTKSSHRQTYQSYEQPPQSLQNLYFQRHFSASKINQTVQIFFLFL